MKNWLLTPRQTSSFLICLLPSSVWQYCQLDLPTTSLTQQLFQIPFMFLTCCLSFCHHSYVWSAPVPHGLLSVLVTSQRARDYFSLELHAKGHPFTVSLCSELLVLCLHRSFWNYHADLQCTTLRCMTCIFCWWVIRVFTSQLSWK